MSTPTLRPQDRPEPIRDALSNVGWALGAAVAVVTFLGSKGVLSTADVGLISAYATQLNDWATDLAAALAAIVNGGLLVGGLKLGARHAAGNSTPSDDPRDRDMTPLVRVDGRPLGSTLPDIGDDALDAPTSTWGSSD